MKKHNFSAGPSILSQDVFSKSSKSILELDNIGLSVLEISHRSKEFVKIMEDARSLSLELLDLNQDEYTSLFLQGGASMQFLMVAYNFLSTNASYIDTGTWSTKAMKEAKLFGKVNELASSKDKNYNYIPKELNQSDNAQYLHLTSNNTIFGTQWNSFPTPASKESYLVADMSSDIFSREFDIKDFGLIYAGAQKNIGPAGVTLVIIRESILQSVTRDIPTMMQYQTHINKESMFNTPPVMSIYAVNQSLRWLDSIGGVSNMELKNKRKAKKLYD